MGILKHKIKRYRVDSIVKVKQETEERNSSICTTENLSNSSQEIPRIISKKIKKQPIRETRKEDSKNIIKNYGKAICNFTTCKVALSYLLPLFEQENVDKDKFLEFVFTNKESLDSIGALRGMLIGHIEDSVEEIQYKKIFQRISEIFLKYFAVNWIYDKEGKLKHKKTHLQYRFKMLRRIKMPHLFTYLR